MQEIPDFRTFWIHQRDLAHRRFRNFTRERMAGEKLAQAKRLTDNIRRIDCIVAGYELENDTVTTAIA